MTAALALDAVLDDPDADEPRLAYADAVRSVDPVYAEFIWLDVEHHRLRREALRHKAIGQEVDAEHGHRASQAHLSAWRRQHEHGIRWAESIIPFALPALGDPGWRYERGFVGYLRTKPSMFLAEDGPPTRTPLQHVDFVVRPGEDVERGLLREVFESPWLESVRSIGLRGTGLDDGDAEALSWCASLANCVWFDLRGNRIGARGMSALAASEITRTRYLLVADNPAEIWLPELAGELAERYGTVRWLEPDRAESTVDRYDARWLSG
jgi:hypothetical protein